MTDVSCFHCGEPTRETRFITVIAGTPRTMCCAGCAAVARAIDDSGLAAYYDSRSAPARREAAEAAAGDLEVYDLPEVRAPFVQRLPGGMARATLLVEGLSCGACAWLVESGLKRIDGVREATVNLAAHRASVEWDEGRVHLSTIMSTIETLGYRASGFDVVASRSAAERERRGLMWRLFVAGLGMMQVMMYAAPVYLSDGDMSPGAEQLMRWAAFVLTTPVVLFSAGPLFSNAWRGLRRFRVGMDVPVALGIAAAFAASAWATVAGQGEVYFDSITMFVFLLLGARYLERSGIARAEELRLRLAQGAPAVAERIVPGSLPPATERVPAVRLVPGDRVQVSPGAVIPADGSVEEGSSPVDESLLTGESRPVRKRPGDFVAGGSVNLASPLTLVVTRAGADGTLACIARLMDRALGERPRIARAADRVAQWFVAALLAVSAAVGLAWFWIEPSRALPVVVAMLVVSCPCALSLATPAAVAAATGSLYRLGLLVTRGGALEALSRATHVIVDKTGTLTVGRMTLAGIFPLGPLGRDACAVVAAALERGSEHPIAKPILAYASGLPSIRADEVRNHPGRGVEGVIGGRRVRIGNPSFASEIAQRDLPAELLLAQGGATAVVLADESGYLAMLTLGDKLRPGARELVRALRSQGKTVCMLSGDRQRAVDHLARDLGVDVGMAEAQPQDKLEFVRGLQSRGAVVAMIGDGINDAPVLAQSQVSIAMGGGTDLARASADIVLLGDDIEVLPAAFDIARRAMRIIRQNLAWAAAYNAVAIPAAAAGWITPLAAGIGMAASSLLVVGNALRLSRAGRRRDTAARGNGAGATLAGQEA